MQSVFVFPPQVLRYVEVQVVVQKKKCGMLAIDKESTEDQALEKAREMPKVVQAMEGKSLMKVVFRPDKNVLQIVVR